MAGGRSIARFRIVSRMDSTSACRACTASTAPRFSISAMDRCRLADSRSWHDGHERLGLGDALLHPDPVARTISRWMTLAA